MTVLDWQCLTWYWTDTNIRSCVPKMRQYCWKEMSAVAYIFYLVHCLLRHEITLHVLCRDKYSTSMQQYCHPGNDSYKQKPYTLGLYDTIGDRANQMLNNVLLVLRTRTSCFPTVFLIRCQSVFNSGKDTWPHFTGDYTGIQTSSSSSMKFCIKMLDITPPNNKVNSTWLWL